MENRVGAELIVPRSATRPGGKNWMLAGMLLLGIIVSLGGGTERAVASPSAEGATTPFQVERHGFNFVNGFDGDILIDLPIFGRVNLGPTSYGLCGGMTFAAVDTFLGTGTAPNDTVAPPSGSALRSYLYNRQTESLRRDNFHLVRQLFDWMGRPIDTRLGVTGLHVLSDREFKRVISARLDEGRPVPIVLVNADIDDFRGNPQRAFSKNHQVLAIGYRLHQKPGDDEWDILIYDPNFPNEVHTLHTGQRIQTDASGNRTHAERFRGLFASPYAYERPYWVPDWNVIPVGLNTLLHAAGDNISFVRSGNPDSFWFRALPNHTAAFRTPTREGLYRLRRIAFNYEIAPGDYTFQVWLLSRNTNGQILRQRIDDGIYILGRQKFQSNRKLVEIDREVKDFEIVFQKGNQLRGAAANDDWLLLGNITLEIAPAP